MRHLKALWFFLSIVWRDFHGVRVSVDSAWQVMMLIHYDKAPTEHIHTIRYTEDGDYELF